MKLKAILLIVMAALCVVARAQVPSGLGPNTGPSSGDKILTWQLGNTTSLVWTTLAQEQTFLTGGITFTASSGTTVTIGAGKTLTFDNTLRFQGSDAAIVNFGGGGTISTVAYSGNYSDLVSGSGQPTSLSAFSNDPGYVTASTSPVRSVNGQTGAVVLSTPSTVSANFSTVAGGVYFVAGGAVINGTLPPTPAQNDTVRIVGQGAAGWNLYANTGQTINFDGTPTATAGYLSGAAGACVEVKCAVAGSSAVWVVCSHEETLTTH